MSFPPRSPNSFPQYIRKEDPRFVAIHRSMMKEQLQQPQSLSRSKSTGSSSLAYNSVNVAPRRLSSGSACEVCRKRKTKCDGGNPCAFCSANGVECIHRATRRKKSSLAIGSSTMATNSTTTTAMNSSGSSSNSSSRVTTNNNNTLITTTNPLFINSNRDSCSTNDRNNSNDNMLICNEGSSTAASIRSGTNNPTITTSPTRIYHNDTAPSWVKELEGPSRNNLLKQTSCPSLIVTTHWSPTTPPHPSLTPTTNDSSSIGGYNMASSTTTTAITTASTTASTNASTNTTGHPLNHPYHHQDHRQTRGDINRGKEEIPSMMDQLSCRTFSAAAFVDHRTNYPIYPLSSGESTTSRSDIRASSSPTPSDNSSSLKMDEHHLL